MQQTPILKIPTLTWPALAVALVVSAVHPLQANPSPDSVDLAAFPAQSIDEVIVPVPSEVFAVLDKLGSPNWRAEIRESLGQQSGNRAQVALLLGTVIAEGFVAVEAEDPEKVKEIGRRVLTLSKAINVEKAVLERSKSITEKAEVKEWDAVRREFDGALQDVKGAMQELGDEDLAQLVSVGGWIRGTSVLTSIIRKNYTPDAAELLNQPALLDFFSKKLDTLSNKRLAADTQVVRVRKLLASLRPLIEAPEGYAVPLENVQRIHKLTNDLVNQISTREA